MVCVVCGGELREQRRYDFRSEAFRRVYSDRFVYRCNRCGLSQVDMGKVDEDLLGRYYVDQYRIVAGAGARSDLNHALWRLRGAALTGLVKQHHAGEPKRIFEVGAGYGVNLQALGRAYPDAELLTDEVSEIVERADGIAQSSFDDGPFDVVLLSHVLEHFTDPVGLLDRAAKALTPGGVLVIEVPNDVDDIARYNVSDEPHLTFFEQPTLKAALDRVEGLELIDLFAAGPTVTRLTMKRRAKSLARAIVDRLPVVSGVAAQWGARKAGRLDFERRNPDGLFLRAVMRR
jgi:SAM-dependent methyltransferase